MEMKQGVKSHVWSEADILNTKELMQNIGCYSAINFKNTVTAKSCL